MCVETRDFKVGDEIEMKLMRKSKGSVYVCPKSEWKDREGVPHNIDGKRSVLIYMIFCLFVFVLICCGLVEVICL